MKSKRAIAAAVMLLALDACYHQVVNTGRPPSAATVDRPFVSTWLWGLVRARPIDVRQQCPSGIAVVTTEQSFLNGAVSLLTAGIYTPQHVEIVCASSSVGVPANHIEVALPLGAPTAVLRADLAAAVKRATDTGEPTVIRFR